MPRRSPVRVTWSRPVTLRRLSPRKGTPRRVSGGRVARLLAYGDAGEASHLDVFADRGDVFREQLTDGFLVVLDVRLVDEDDLGKVAVEAPFDDLSDHVFRFAFCCGFFGQAGAFGFDFVCRDVVAVRVRRVGHRNVDCQVLRELLEYFVAGNEVRFAVQLHHRGDLAVVVQVHADEAFGGFTVRFVGGAGDAAFTQQGGGLVDVAFRFGQRVLDVHHSGAGQRAELFDAFHGYCHFRVFSSVFSRLRFRLQLPVRLLRRLSVQRSRQLPFLPQFPRLPWRRHPRCCRCLLPGGWFPRQRRIRARWTVRPQLGELRREGVLEFVRRLRQLRRALRR